MRVSDDRSNWSRASGSSFQMRCIIVGHEVERLGRVGLDGPQRLDRVEAGEEHDVAARAELLDRPDERAVVVHRPRHHDRAARAWRRRDRPRDRRSTACRRGSAWAGRWNRPTWVPSSWARSRRAAAMASIDGVGHEVGRERGSAVGTMRRVDAGDHPAVGERDDLVELTSRELRRHRLGDGAEHPAGHGGEHERLVVGERDGDHVALARRRGRRACGRCGWRRRPAPATSECGRRRR